MLGLYFISYPTAWTRVLVPVLFFFWTFDLPAVLVLAFWFVSQFFSGIAAITHASRATSGDVAVWAHVAGFVFGAIVGLALSLGSPPERRPPRPYCAARQRAWSGAAGRLGADLAALLLAARLVVSFFGLVAARSPVAPFAGADRIRDAAGRGAAAGLHCPRCASWAAFSRLTRWWRCWPCTCSRDCSARCSCGSEVGLTRVPWLGSADLHLHTLASDGLICARDLVEHVEAHTDLDVIAVTDHDETSAALEAREWAARRGYRVQVIPGRRGHHPRRAPAGAVRRGAAACAVEPASAPPSGSWRGVACAWRRIR